MPTPQQLAKSIVKESLRPKEYEVVTISTYPHTIELAEQVALECQKAGADPITLLETDEVFYGQYKNYSLENLRKVSGHCLGLAEYTQSYIWLGGPKDPGRMAKVPREKWAAANEGEQAHTDKWLVKKPKSVGVGLGQVTRERAARYGFNYASWKRGVENAIATNYRQMEKFGKTVAGLLSVPVSVRVTADNGTDLRFRLAGASRKAHVNDGVISDEDFAAENRDASLPAGDVWVAPVEDSAKGTIVSDVRIPQMGKLIEGLAWTFENGRVTDYTAKKNLNLAQTGWETGTGGKDVLGTFALGINPKAKSGFLQNTIPAGSVTIGIGDNRNLDGTNKSSYGFYAFHSAPNVEIAGKTVIEEGRWVV
jgi:leucyl aminopeptidase (aminopeptidase T)